MTASVDREYCERTPSRFLSQHRTSRMRRIVRSLLAVTLLAGAACSSVTDLQSTTTDQPTHGIIAGEVQTTRVAGGVRFTNGTEHTVGYAVVNPNWLGLIAACATEPACPKLAPGESVVVRDQDIAGYGPGMTVAVAYWWSILPDAAGRPRAGTMSQRQVSL